MRSDKQRAATKKFGQFTYSLSNKEKEDKRLRPQVIKQPRKLDALNHLENKEIDKQYLTSEVWEDGNDYE